MGTHRFKLKGITPGDLSASVPSGGTFSALGPSVFIDINLNDDGELPLLTNFMKSIGWEFNSSNPPSPPGVKEVFLPGTNYANDYGDFRTRSQGATGAQRYTFPIPHDFNSLVSLTMITIPNTLPNADDNNISLDSDYSQLAEPFNNHTESATVSAKDYFTAANDMSELDISSVFSALAAGDRCGLFINHTGIGTTVDYLMVRLRYT